MRAECPLRVGIRCDAGPVVGVGHLVRCVALAEELVARGHEVLFLADLGGLPFAERQLSSRRLPHLAPPGGPEAVLRRVRDLGLDALVLDSYVEPSAVSAALVDDGVPVLAIVDGSTRGQSAQLYLDQNIGAEGDEVALPSGARRLAGTSYALLRDDVVRRRPSVPWAAPTGSLRVVVAYGGTDAYGMTAHTVAALVATGAALTAVVVTPDPDVRAAVPGLAGPGQRLEAVAPHDGFPSLLAEADLVIGASGTSAWEYACLGRAAAVVAVVDNQHSSYDRLVRAGAVLGLGLLGEVLTAPHLLQERLARVVADEPGRRAAAAAAYRLVDGLGRERVATALQDLVTDRR